MLKKLSFLLAFVFCLFHCWTAMFGAAAGIGQKAIHLGLVLIIFFLDYLSYFYLISAISQTDRNIEDHRPVFYYCIGRKPDLYHVN